MSGPAALACLVLTVALSVGGIVLLVRAAGRDDSAGDLLGLTAIITAGFPAAVYGAAAG